MLRTGHRFEGVQQPGQAVGDALLGHREPVQAEQDPDRLLFLLVVARGGACPARLLDRVLEDQHGTVRDGGLQGLVGVGHRALGERGAQRGGLQGGVPRDGGLFQQPADQRLRAPLVAGAAGRAEQRPGEAVGLFGAHPGTPSNCQGPRSVPRPPAPRALPRRAPPAPGARRPP
ncbi:hypothetical protein O1L68_33160 [Streptomyces lydicus]|nr:hypothetical protein [Streptomyces lydicus]